MRGFEAATGVVVRHAARAVLLDPEDHVLLLACLDPTRDDAERFWITPGGGLDDGETHDAALRRELREELGLGDADVVEPGPWVWRRVHTFRWLGRTLEQHERFRVVRTRRTAFDISGRSRDEADALTAHRWFTVGEIASFGERVAPSRLAELLAALLRDGPPAAEIDVGV